MKNRAPSSAGAKIAANNPLHDVVAEAYRVFDTPEPASIEVCTGCCMNPDIEADFFNPAIEDLLLAYVRDWFFAAYDLPAIARETWAYLLPRILEILASGEDVASVGLEVSLQRFETGNREHWSAQQWAVLDAFQRQYLDLQLKQKGPFAGSGDPIDDVLCMFALGGWPVEALTAQLLSADAEVLARRLHHDWSLDHYRESGAIWITAFWEAAERDAVWAFYTSQVLHDRMAELAMHDATEPWLAEMAYRVASVIGAHHEREA